MHEYNTLQWNQRWITSETGSHTRKFFPQIIDRQNCKSYFSSSFYVTQFITGHGKFNAYLHRFNLRNSKTCICDNFSIQTPEHIIFHCILYERRQKLKDKSIELYNLFPCNFHQLIHRNIFNIFKEFCKISFI